MNRHMNDGETLAPPPLPWYFRPIGFVAASTLVAAMTVGAGYLWLVSE